MLLAAVASLVIGSPLVAAGTGGISLLTLLALNRGRYTASGAFGLANVITLGRLFLTVSLAALGGVSPGSSAALLVTGIFALDGLDGWVARKKGEASALGARFDMECDALLVLVCALVLYLHHRLPAFILLPGVLRYLYALLLLLPWAKGEAPRSRWGRYVFAAMIVSFVLSFWPLEPWHRPLSVIATTMIVASFSHSFYWSCRRA